MKSYFFKVSFFKFCKIAFVIFLCIFSFTSCSIVMDFEEESSDYVQNVPESILAPFSNTTCKNKTVSEVYDAFYDAGFCDVLCIATEIEFDSTEFDNRETINITVDGELLEDLDIYYKYDAEIRINYAEKPFAKVVQFGKYEQDNDLDSKEPIEWYVLFSDENNSLLISRQILTVKAFNDTIIAEGTSWENSSLRKWLNTEFYNEAFSHNEKKYIDEKSIQDYKADNKLGNITYDKVFLLSYDEVQEYFPHNVNMATTPTEYAKTIEYSSSWWLLNSYISDLYKYVVNSSGAHENSPRVNEEQGVRPVIWIDNNIIN